MIVAALAGTLAGFVHVLSGPDHLAALAPLASDGDRRPWRAGALWGLGHSSGVHGFAGSSHFLGVLPALALPGLAASLSYLGGFGAGTVVAMSGFASVIGLIAARAKHRGPIATRWLLSACSTVAVIVGIAWLTL